MGNRFFIVFVCALGLRLLCFGLFPWPHVLIDGYDKIALSIISGSGFSYDTVHPTVTRGPAYPIYVAVTFLVSGGRSLFALRIVSCILDAFTAGMLVRLGRTVWWRDTPRYGVVAGLLYAINPFAIYYTVKLGSETLAAFALIVFLVVYMKLICFPVPRPLYAVLLGAASGFLVLNKSVFLPIVLLLFCTIPPLSKRLSTARLNWRVVAVCTGVMLLVIAPWSIRNMLVSGRPVLVQTLTGFNFWYDFALDANRNSAIRSGNLDSTYTGGPVKMPDGTEFTPYSISAAEDAAGDAILTREALRWVIANLVATVWKILDNIASFWYLLESPRKMIVGGLFSCVLLLMAWVGIKKWPPEVNKAIPVFLAGVVALIVFAYSPIMAVFRYSLVTYPILSLLIAPGFESLIRRRSIPCAD